MPEEASAMALPGEECRVLPRESWSDLEKWVWQEIGSGCVADINVHLGKTAGPEKPDDWGTDRRLSSAFLETILLHDPWQGAIPRQGVRIVAARFDEEVNLENARITPELWLDRTRFAAGVRLRSLRADSFLSLEGSRFADALDLSSAKVDALNLDGATVGGTLILNSARIEGHLFMRKRAQFADVDLRQAKVGGGVDMSGAIVSGTLNLNSAMIEASLFMREGAQFADVDLHQAKVGGQLDMSGATVGGTLNLNGAEIEAGLFMLEGALFADVDLRGAKVRRQLVMNGATVSGGLSLVGAEITADVFCRDADLAQPVDLRFAKVMANLDLRGASIFELDLTGTRIAGELRLASDSWSCRWRDQARLVLRNASADTIQDEPAAWPEVLELDGFTYNRFGGSGAGAEAVVAKRGAQWFAAWLAKDTPYTPQPSNQCASVLRAMGHPDMANAVLYAGREREREEARRTSKLRWLGLSLLNPDSPDESNI
jgi:uncharacterized protein YjbI with pentapeptide repeats